VGRCVVSRSNTPDVLAVVAFAVGESEQAPFKMGSLPFTRPGPKQSRCFVIGDAREAVFPPAVGAGAAWS